MRRVALFFAAVAALLTAALGTAEAQDFSQPLPFPLIANAGSNTAPGLAVGASTVGFYSPAAGEVSIANNSGNNSASNICFDGAEMIISQGTCAPVNIDGITQFSVSLHGNGANFNLGLGSYTASPTGAQIGILKGCSGTDLVLGTVCSNGAHGGFQRWCFDNGLLVSQLQVNGLSAACPEVVNLEPRQNSAVAFSETQTGNTTNGSNVVSGLPSISNFATGMNVSGVGIPSSPTDTIATPVYQTGTLANGSNMISMPGGTTGYIVGEEAFNYSVGGGPIDLGFTIAAVSGTSLTLSGTYTGSTITNGTFFGNSLLATSVVLTTAATATGTPSITVSGGYIVTAAYNMGMTNTNGSPKYMLTLDGYNQVICVNTSHASSVYTCPNTGYDLVDMLGNLYQGGTLLMSGTQTVSGQWTFTKGQIFAGDTATTLTDGECVLNVSNSNGAVWECLGSSNDWLLENSSGTAFLKVPTGTTTVDLMGAVNIASGALVVGSPTTGSFTGAAGQVNMAGCFVNGVACSTGGTPGGSSGNVQTNNGSGGFNGLTNTQLTADINTATASLSGALPAWPNNTTTFFRGDGTYETLNFAALSGTAATGQVSGSYTGITGVGTLTAGSIGSGFTAIPNSALANSATTVGGSTCTLGSTCAPVPAPSFGYVSGNYYTTPFYGSASTTAVTASTIYFEPFQALGGAGFTKIYVNIGTGVSTGECEVGLWQNNGGVPGTLISDLGEIAAGTSNTGKQGLTGLTAFMATAGDYFLGVACNSSTITLASAPTTNALSGMYTGFGGTSGGAPTYQLAWTFLTGNLPNGSGATITSGAANPLVFVSL